MNLLESSKKPKLGVNDPIVNHPLVSPPEWLAARKELLKQEKELTRLMDQVNEARRALPWEKVTRDYVFEGPDGPVDLAGLFKGRRQLIVYHFMLAPGWDEGCVGCSHFGDQVDGPRRHFEQVDVKFYAVSRAPIAEIETFKRRMGWTFDWVSSRNSSFNQDYRVSFTPAQVAAGEIDYNYGTSAYPFEELPGISVFYKDAEGTVYHTYSTYARGLDILLNTHHFLDLTPKGRCEDGVPGDGWLRHHDNYEDVYAEGCGCGKKEAP